MNFFSKKIVGIDFHDYSAQVVELSMKKNQISLEGYNRILIPPNIIIDGEIVKKAELQEQIAVLLKGANPKPINPKHIAVVFPSAKVFTHIFTFPSNITPEEIRKALQFEAEKIIPFSINDVYWDDVILGESKEKNSEGTKVLFAAIIKDIADQYIKLFGGLGIESFLFGIDVESLKYGMIKQLDPIKADLIIDIGTLSVNYLITKNGEIQSFSGISKGGKNFISSLSRKFQVSEEILIRQKEKNNLSTQYSPEIKKFLEDSYKYGKKVILEAEKNKNIGPVKNVFLTGEFLNFPGFYETAKKNFPKQVIQIGDPRKYLKIDAKKFRQLKAGEGATYNSPYFINAVGVALRGLLAKPTQGINLLPDSLKKKVANKKFTILLAVIAVAMSAISLFLATYIFFTHQDLRYERQVLEVQKSSTDKLLHGTRYQEIRDGITSFNKEVEELNDIEGVLISMPVLIKNIVGLIPKEISLTGLTYDDADLAFEITGIAKNRESLLEANNNFREVDYISEVVTPISNFDEKYKISFVIELKLDFKELAKYGESTNN